MALTLLGQPLDAASYAAALPRPAPILAAAPTLAPDHGHQYYAAGPPPGGPPAARSVSPVTPPGGFRVQCRSVSPVTPPGGLAASRV